MGVLLVDSAEDVYEYCIGAGWSLERYREIRRAEGVVFEVGRNVILCAKRIWDRDVVIHVLNIFLRMDSK